MRTPTMAFAALLMTTCTVTAAAPSSCRPVNSFEQGHELRQNQMMAAYNAPARVEVRGSWDLYLDGSYLFWQPMQENLELGISNNSPSNQLPIDGNVVGLNYKYKSGFKAGMGIFSAYDNWDAHFCYTWSAGRHTARSNGPFGGGIIPFWGHPNNVPSPANTHILTGKEVWRLRLELFDLTLGRSCYVGTRLTFHPYYGARGALIDQKSKVFYGTQTIASGAQSTYQIRQTTTSWGLGPEVGIDTSWMLGYGIRIVGTAEADVLYTRYHLRYKEQNSSNPSSTFAVNLRQRHFYYLRPHMDLEMGFGWGSYFLNHNYHIDLQGTYGFQVFWGQNMFRKFMSSSSVGTSQAPNGDLYIQGATATARFDF